MTYDEAFALLRKYNSEPFHITHALTVSNVMRRMANELGYGDEADFWAIVGLLHDIDFEQWPNEHCKKCVELLQAGGADERLIHAVVCHGYGLCVDVKPEHEMEKVLFACDELIDRRMRKDASFRQHHGHGSQESQEEIQVEGICGGLFPRGHRAGRGNARLGAGRAALPHA